MLLGKCQYPPLNLNEADVYDIRMNENSVMHIFLGIFNKQKDHNMLENNEN